MLSTPKYPRTYLEWGFGSRDWRIADGRETRAQVQIREWKRYGRLAGSDEHSSSFAVPGSECGHALQVCERAKDSGVQVRQSLALQEIEARSVDGRAVHG